MFGKYMNLVILAVLFLVFRMQNNYCMEALTQSFQHCLETYDPKNGPVHALSGIMEECPVDAACYSLLLKPSYFNKLLEGGIKGMEDKLKEFFLDIKPGSAMYEVLRLYLNEEESFKAASAEQKLEIEKQLIPFFMNNRDTLEDAWSTVWSCNGKKIIENLLHNAFLKLLIRSNVKIASFGAHWLSMLYAKGIRDYKNNLLKETSENVQLPVTFNFSIALTPATINSLRTLKNEEGNTASLAQRETKYVHALVSGDGSNFKEVLLGNQDAYLCYDDFMQVYKGQGILDNFATLFSEKFTSVAHQQKGVAAALEYNQRKYGKK